MKGSHIFLYRFSKIIPVMFFMNLVQVVSVFLSFLSQLEQSPFGLFPTSDQPLLRLFVPVELSQIVKPI